MRQVPDHDGQLVGGQPARRVGYRPETADVRDVAQRAESTDSQGVVLRYLAAIKAAVAQGAGLATDMNALRNVIGQTFESVELT